MTANRDQSLLGEKKKGAKMNCKHRKPRVVLYLGAGASFFAGYQTFVTFPELLFNRQLRATEVCHHYLQILNEYLL